MKALSRFSKKLLPWLVVILVWGVSHAHATSYQGPVLTQQAAKERSKRVTNVSYQLELTLPAEEKTFHGHALIHFSLSSNVAPLRLDFTQGQINSLLVNGKRLSHVNYQNNFILIPATHLKSGSNTVDIDYSHAYSQDGTGLYRYVDPEDNKVYIYSQFEPYDANKVFPAFDQPDLKATFQLKVTAPADWTVVSTMTESQVVETKNATRTWYFPATPKLSTYVFSVHAGPYYHWEDHSGKIPLRLFARQSLARYIDYREWFRITQEGLKFFDKYFNYPYPYPKYDQLVVPDFNAGAMENVGAVTFSENYVSKAPMTQEHYQHWVEVILHEMAHMWFGNLVTMRWWNDLWLNESFATYLAFVAADQGLKLTDVWLNFYLFKLFAYQADELVTTHAILAHTPDTEAAMNQFDAITYAKGAAVLKQLDFYLAEDHFRTGVQHYMQTYAFRNAELKDFFAALTKTSQINLNSFAKQWLTTTGFNTLEFDYHCVDNRLSTITVRQQGSPLRNHRTSLGLYTQQADGKVIAANTIPLSYGKMSTQVKSENLTCPTFIYPNETDQDYVKPQFDKQTTAFVMANLPQIQSPLTRAMLWQGLWEQVLDAKLALPQYLTTVVQHLGEEQHPLILTRMLSTVAKGLTYFPLDSAAVNYRNRYLNQVEQLLWQQLITAKPGSELQKLWLDNFIKLAEQPTSLAKLADLLQDKTQLTDLSLDQTRRWEIIKRLNVFAHPLAQQLLLAESAHDKSSEGYNKALAAQVSRPDLAEKRVWFTKLSDGKNHGYSLAKQKIILYNLFPASQHTLLAEFAPMFYQALPKLSQDSDNLFVAEYSRYWVPNLCTANSSKQLRLFLQNHPKLNLAVRRNLLEAQQEDERCIKIRKLASQAIANH